MLDLQQERWIYLLKKVTLVHKIVRHPVTNIITDAIPIVVPSKYEINNVLFPYNETRWMFDKFQAKDYHYLVDNFFKYNDVMYSDYQGLLEKIGNHYAVIFKSTCVRLMLKMMIYFMYRPKQFADDIMLVIQKMLIEWKIYLYRRLYSLDKYYNMPFSRGTNVDVAARGTLPFKYLKSCSEASFDALYDEAKLIFPKYKKNRDSKQQ